MAQKRTLNALSPTLLTVFPAALTDLFNKSPDEVGFYTSAYSLISILGALALGDMGDHFPDSDPRWSGADSSAFVSRVVELAAAEGFELVNCDLTFIGERPRISPHRESLRASLADSLGVPQSAVSVKATTTERLGFVGRAEGLAALAVVLMAKGGGDG